MKKILTTFFVLFISISAFSQNLSLSEILSIRSMDIGRAEEYLSNKGWTLYSIEKPAGPEYGLIGFKYSGIKFNSNTSRLYIMYLSDRNADKRIAMMTTDKDKYNEYIKQINQRGARSVYSTVEETGIRKTFLDPKYTYRVFVEPSEKTEPIYSILIYTNEDYKKSFID